MASNPRLPQPSFSQFGIPSAASMAPPANVDQLFGNGNSAPPPMMAKPPRLPKAPGALASPANVHGSSLAAKPTRQPHPTKPGRDVLGRLMPGATLQGAAAPFGTNQATTRSRQSGVASRRQQQ